MITEFRTLIEPLSLHEVEFVIIGGLALVLRGSGRTTQDSISATRGKQATFRNSRLR